MDVHQETEHIQFYLSKAPPPTPQIWVVFRARVIQGMDLHIKRLYIQTDPGGEGAEGVAAGPAPACEDVWKELCCPE